MGLTNWSSKRRLIICPSDRSLGATNLSLRAPWDAERGMENFCRWLFCCCCQNGWLSQRGVHRKTDRPPYTLGPRYPTPTPSPETHNPQPHCHFKCGQTLLSLKPYLCITWSEGCKSFFSSSLGKHWRHFTLKLKWRLRGADFWAWNLQTYFLKAELKKAKHYSKTSH